MYSSHLGPGHRTGCACSCCSRATPCICGQCVGKLGPVQQQRAKLKEQLQDIRSRSLALLELKDIVDRQQYELNALRQRAAEVRSASMRIQRKLRVLQGCRREQPPSVGSRLQVLQAIDQLSGALQQRWREGQQEEEALQDTLHYSQLDLNARRSRALLDVLSSVPPLLPPRSLEKAKTSPRGVPPGQLYTAARADSRLAMYLSDALGHLNLFLRVVSAIFQLPMAYGTDFRGVHSLVWTPTDHHASETAPPAHACSLRVHTSSGQQDAERAKNDWGAAVHATQRNAAIALCQYPQVCVSDSTLLSPMEWLVEVCCVLLEEGGGTECLGRSEAVCRLQTGTRRFSTQQYGGPLEEPEGQDDREDEEGWELMAAGGESDFDIQDGGTSQYAIGAVVNRLRRLASNYRDAAV